MSTTKPAVLAIGLTFCAAALAAAAEVNYGYVANAAGASIFAYRVEGDGSLTAVGTTSVGAEPVGIAAHPTLPVIYVTTATAPAPDGSITAYSVNGDTGALSELQTLNPTEHPSSIAINVPGSYAYVIDVISEGQRTYLTVYSIDAEGTLTEAQATPDWDGEFVDLVLHPYAPKLYAVSFESWQIVIFEIDPADGTLILGMTDILDLPSRPQAFAIHPSGDYGYSACVNMSGDGTVGALEINPDGSLNPPFDSDSVGPTSGGSLNVTAHGDHVYVANPGSDNIHIFTVQGDGSLTALTSMAAGTDPAELVFNSNGSIAYCVAEGSDEVIRFTVEPDGSLTQVGITATGDGPIRMALISVEADEAIPTLSEWGMVVLTLLVLAAATILLRRRHPAVC